MRWKRIIYMVLACMLIFGTVCVPAAAAEITDDVPYFSAEEQQILNEINPSFITMPEVLELKEQGRLEELTDAIEEEYEKRYAAEADGYARKLENWGLKPDMTVTELSNLTQDYLNENYNGIQINSMDFQQLVKKMFQGDSFPLTKMAEDDPAFGAAYLYMCIYYDENIDENTGTFINKADKPLGHHTEEKTLHQIFEEDFDRNFQESVTMEVLHRMSAARAAKSFSMRMPEGSSALADNSFLMAAGETVTIKASYLPFGASVDFGLVDSDGVFHYFNTTNGNIDKTMQIDESGSYTLKVRNNSNQEVKVSGFIKY
ncbi:MAG: hypothetical protein Q4D50_03470 [Eubacteriales bacterium]|nr:hypothetical protein [Eubacteriales bacterium]